MWEIPKSKPTLRREIVTLAEVMFSLKLCGIGFNVFRFAKSSRFFFSRQDKRG